MKNRADILCDFCLKMRLRDMGLSILLEMHLTTLPRNSWKCRFSFSPEGPSADTLAVTDATEAVEVWYWVESANYQTLVDKVPVVVLPRSIEGAVVTLGAQVTDLEGNIVQPVESVEVDGLSATMVLPPVLEPGDGTVFTNAVTVMLLPPEGVTYYFTTNGTTPTASSMYVKRIRLTEKTTIKAIAVKDGRLWSAVTEATYALGRCQEPVIRLADCGGAIFHFAEQPVVIDWNEEDGVLRYTLDGSEPTPESRVYEGPISISETTVVKAKVFSDRYFDSSVVMAEFMYERLSVEMPVLTATAVFTGTSAEVGMSCATPNAVIRYTLDGSEPNETSAIYAEGLRVPCELDCTVVVRARAFCEGYTDSSVSSIELRRVWGYGDALGVPDWTFETDDGDAGWFSVTNVTGVGEIALRNGMVDDYETSSIRARISGGGTLSFRWKASTEMSGDYSWDHAEFYVDGECLSKIEGVTGWVVFEYPLDEGEHDVEWRYVKDDMLSEEEDAVYLSCVRLAATTTIIVPASTTGSKEIVVENEWFEKYPVFEAKFGTDKSAAMTMKTGKIAADGHEMAVWEDYVAGTDPTNPEDKFKVKAIKVENGKVEIEWEPDLNEKGTKNVRVYKTFGSNDLKSWDDATGKESGYKFFKVSVDMP